MSETNYTSGTGALDRIYDMVQGALPGVALNMVQGVLLDTLEEFCRRSIYWRARVQWLILPGQASVKLTVGDGIAVTLILDIGSERWWYNNAPGITSGWNARRYQIIPPNTIFDPCVPAFTTVQTGIGDFAIGDTGIGDQPVVTQQDPSVVRQGVALVVCKPTSLAAELPSFLIDDWSEAIRDGVLSRLMMQPSKPYSNVALGKYHGQRFRNQMVLARVQARSFNDYPLFRFPYFARGSQYGGFSQGRFFSQEPT